MGDLQFSGDVVVYLLGLAAMWGTLIWRVSTLEKKVDKHNCLVERMAIVEQKAASAHKRLDEIKGGH